MLRLLRWMLFVVALLWLVAAVAHKPLLLAALLLVAVYALAWKLFGIIFFVLPF